MPALILPLIEAAAHWPERGALVGLDLGTKTIGVAVSDPDRKLATGIETIARTTFTKDAARLLALSTLLVPLDTHVARLSWRLGLTRRRTLGWKAAEEVTENLRLIDAEDPVRFDFSLCHVGMMNACGWGRRQGDAQCPLKGICRPHAKAAAGASRSRRSSSVS